MVGGITLDTASVLTATTINSWTSTVVISSDGDLSVPVFTPVIFKVTAAPWTFNPSTANSPMWTVGIFTFSLDSDKFIQYYDAVKKVNTLSIAGTGTIKATGYDETAYVWNFSSQDPGAGNPKTFSFSASALGVPDGGATCMMLGSVLSALSMIKRKFLV